MSEQFITHSDITKSVSEENERKIQAKQETSSAVESIIKNEQGREALSALISAGGPLGRRIGREINRVLSGKNPSQWLVRQAQNGAIKKISSEVSDNSSKAQYSPVKTGALISLSSLKSEAGKKEWGFKQIETPVVPCGLGLYVKGNDVWVRAGTIDNEFPDGFNAMDGKFIASYGDGYVLAKVTINESTGEIEDTDVISSNSLPEDTTTVFYTPLGRYEYRYINSAEVPYVVTYECGSISVLVCRNWYTTEPPLYTVVFSR
jgi:hypothetical protein